VASGDSPTVTLALPMAAAADGIDVNNMFTRPACNGPCGGDFGGNGSGTGRTPDCCPWAFRQGVAVRDNYVFQVR
jgi:hypothetical protein